MYRDIRYAARASQWRVPRRYWWRQWWVCAAALLVLIELGTPASAIITPRRSIGDAAYALSRYAAISATHTQRENDGTTHMDQQSKKNGTTGGAKGTSTTPVAGQIAAAPTWQQTFAGLPNGPFSSSVWSPENDPAVPGYNGEAQAYANRANNLFIENGKLVLAAHRESYQYPGDSSGKTYAYTSARIDTHNSFTFEYGRLEARIKMPKGKGVWPAWWFLSANQPFTSKLPPDWDSERFYMHDGELDAAEVYGQLPGLLEGTLYTFNKTYEKSTTVADMAEAFHTYGVEVTPTKVVWSVDGKAYQTVQRPSDNPDDWPFTGGNKLYMILNVALGGSGGGNTIDDTQEPNWRMEVESIKYYPYK